MDGFLLGNAGAFSLRMAGRVMSATELTLRALPEDFLGKIYKIFQQRHSFITCAI